MTPLSGMVPPLITPLTAEGDIDGASLVRLISHQLEAGADGIFVLGTSGEAALLTDDQRRLVLEAAVAEVGGQVPVLTGVIDTSTARSAAHVVAARKAGADAVVATAPFYAATHPAEIERHFRRLADCAEGLPVYAYNIPSRVNGTSLPAALLVRLGAEGVLAGVKDSSGRDAGLRRVVLAREAAGLSDFAVLTGSELTVDSALAFGVDGVVPGLGNVDPAGYVRLLEAARAGDWDAARSEQNRLFRLFDITGAGDASRMSGGSSALGAFKAALQLLGVIDCASTAYPSVPLDDDERARVRSGLVAAQLL